MNAKKIIILDDHCQDAYFYLLEDYLNVIKKYFKDKHKESVEFTKCSDIKEFANILLADDNIEYAGWIVDMMIPTENLANYSLLGRADIAFNTARSGMLALKVIIEYDMPTNKLSDAKKSRLAALANHPALIFSILREDNLSRELNQIGITDTKKKQIFSASKESIDVVDFELSKNVKEWCDQVIG